MSGFDCEFVEKPPKVLQTDCPVCLLILCEPYQVTCCGKSFCKECIGKIKARIQACPTCKQDKFESFPNKGLQQPLYGFAVLCSNKERGCVWEGELGQLDQHINSNPDKEKQLVGCAYTNIVCIFCDKLHPRHEMEQHQASICPKRPFTCSLCEEYESTYEDVMNSHAPVCKCRPVECPNSCGADNLQHQHLEEHVSCQCPLTYVECEFSDAGCDAKVYRKDLASHLTDNLVTHMSLLAMENRKLKQQLQKQEEKACTACTEIRELKLQLEKAEAERKYVRGALGCMLPIDLMCPADMVKSHSTWLSKPFYDRIGSDKLQLKCHILLVLEVSLTFYDLVVVRLERAKLPRHVKKVTIVLVDPEGSQNLTFQKDVIANEILPPHYGNTYFDHARYCKNGRVIFHITDVQY